MASGSSPCGVLFPWVEGAGKVSMSLVVSHTHDRAVVTWVLGDQGPQLHLPGQRREQGTCLSVHLGQGAWAQIWGPLLFFLVGS